MNSVVHFEIPVDDENRATNFYSSVFGWECENMGEDYGNYIVATTTPLDKNSMRPKELI